MEQKQHYIYGLDGLRAFAMMLVLASHSFSTTGLCSDVLEQLIHINARFGVMMFFVMSGYLITHIILKEHKRSGTLNLRKFYFKRYLRIFPAFYCYLGCLLLLRGLGALSTSQSAILSAATFTLNYQDVWNPTNHSLKDYWFVGHFWTLALEQQFYLLWPTALLVCGVSHVKRWILVALLFCPVSRLLTYFLFPHIAGQIYIMSHTLADPIVAGCALALWEGEPWFEGLRSRFSSSLIPALAGVTAFVFSPLLSMRWGAVYELPIGIFLNSLCAAVLVFWFTQFIDNPVGRLLNSRFITWIGLLSYSLYLWQQLFLTPLNATWTGRFPINLLMCFFAAAASYYLIEKPFLLWRDRRLTKSVRRV